MPPPDKPKAATGQSGTGQSGNWSELDRASRDERLAAKLRANLARRKQQARGRDAVSEPEDGGGKSKP